MLNRGNGGEGGFLGALGLLGCACKIADYDQQRDNRCTGVHIGKGRTFHDGRNLEATYKKEIQIQAQWRIFSVLAALNGSYLGVLRILGILTHHR